MIRIISGWSNTGGSTVALINLTNALNEAGYETIFSGPHSWHLDKCKSEQYIPNSKMKINKEDTLIVHFKVLQQRPPVKKVILVCHEKWWFEISKIPQFWDTVIFLHEEHYQYHKKNGYNGNYVLIPNLKEKFEKSSKEHLNKVAGIIGSIEDRKKTHLSIQRALDDGCDKIYIFGNIINDHYFNFYIKPLLNDKVEYKGFCDNKQMIYNMIGRVYHSSIGEVASLVKDECYSTGTKFFGSDETNNEISNISNEEIIKKWFDIMEVKNNIVFIDGGAHSGETITDLLDKRPEMSNCKVLFYEPNRNYLEILNKIKEENKKYDIEVNMKALWKNNETLDFYTSIDRWNDLGCTLLREKKEKLDLEHPCKVECVRLSDLIFSLKHKYIILKLDIEGAEYDVLNDLFETGAIDLVKELYIEWHDWFFDNKNSVDLRNKLNTKNIILREWK